MDWTQPIFAYCERGIDPAFWAEPFNAVSNVAFLVVSAIGFYVWWQRPRHQRGRAEFVLIVLVALIGAGSFAFHTQATRWGMAADVIPIGLFMFAYAAFALRRFLRLTRWGVALALVLFAALLDAASILPCPQAWYTLAPGRACLNGSLGYAPALIMLALVSAKMGADRHELTVLMVAAALVFALSLTARSLDFAVCARTQWLGAPRGTHALWHLLNAITLGLLLLAALKPAPTTASHPQQ